MFPCALIDRPVLYPGIMASRSSSMTHTDLAPPHTKESPRQRLLEVADALFYAEGVHVVGIDRILKEAGVAKASLYLWREQPKAARATTRVALRRSLQWLRDSTRIDPGLVTRRGQPQSPWSMRRQSRMRETPE